VRMTRIGPSGTMSSDNNNDSTTWQQWKIFFPDVNATGATMIFRLFFPMPPGQQTTFNLSMALGRTATQSATPAG